jgi:putative DNA primase/helicase
LVWYFLIYSHNCIIKQQCRLIEPEVTNHIINEVISYIKDTTYIDRSEFDKNPDLLCLQNDVLNIRTKKLMPHLPDYLSLTQLPIEYNPEAKCPRIEKFLNDVLDSKEDVKYMYWDIGYCLLSDCRYQTSVMLYGNSGANGKGTLLELKTLF